MSVVYLTVNFDPFPRRVLRPRGFNWGDDYTYVSNYREDEGNYDSSLLSLKHYLELMGLDKWERCMVVKYMYYSAFMENIYTVDILNCDENLSRYNSTFLHQDSIISAQLLIELIGVNFETK